MAAKKETVLNTMLVALVLCLVCAVVVASAAVILKPQQDTNKQLYRQQNVLKAAGLYEPGMNVAEAFERIERKFIDLDTGEYVDKPVSYDQREASRRPDTSIDVEPDPAGIQRRAKVAEVFLARTEDGLLTKIILPVHGYGLWSTMYGFLSLQPDANTVAGIAFYEHGETPGLGGEIENPGWQEKWQGKELRNDEGELVFEVIKGSVDPSMANTEHRMDGLSGATLTTKGVSEMVRYWTGERAFGPYLQRMRNSS
jgi:Na+-transporting NADH:ubiquinone oxidoreductase subunit C